MGRLIFPARIFFFFINCKNTQIWPLLLMGERLFGMPCSGAGGSVVWAVAGGAGLCSLRGNWLFHRGRFLLGNQPPLLSVTLAALRWWGGKTSHSSSMVLAFIPHPACQLLLESMMRGTRDAPGRHKAVISLVLPSLCKAFWSGIARLPTKHGDPILAILSP